MKRLKLWIALLPVACACGGSEPPVFTTQDADAALAILRASCRRLPPDASRELVRACGALPDVMLLPPTIDMPPEASGGAPNVRSDAGAGGS